MTEHYSSALWLRLREILQETKPKPNQNTFHVWFTSLRWIDSPIQSRIAFWSTCCVLTRLKTQPPRGGDAAHRGSVQNMPKQLKAQLFPTLLFNTLLQYSTRYFKRGGRSIWESPRTKLKINSARIASFFSWNCSSAIRFHQPVGQGIIIQTFIFIRFRI